MDYEMQTTFWLDFTIADAFGAKAIKDTYERGKDYAHSDYKVATEFVMVLNWKCWQMYEKGNNKVSELYADLFYKEQDWCFKHLKGEELSYFIQTTD